MSCKQKAMSAADLANNCIWSLLNSKAGSMLCRSVILGGAGGAMAPPDCGKSVPLPLSQPGRADIPTT